MNLTPCIHSDQDWVTLASDHLYACSVVALQDF